MLKIWVLVFLTSGCIRSQVTTLKYADYGMYTGDTPGNKVYEEFGPVKGSAVSWSFANCEKLVIKAVSQMVENAKTVGANTIYNVRFGQTGTKTIQETIPFCKRRLALLMFLVPMWADVRVNGIAAKVESPAASLDTIHFKSNQSSETIASKYYEKIVANQTY